MAITTQNGAYADPNTNMGKQLTKEYRGDTYLAKEWSDGTGESTFGLPEWIPDGNGNYTPYIILENPNTYVIENKYLPMSINKADCMTTLYLNNENILNGADTLMEKQYWEVYHKENETDNYQLLDTTSWDCETTFSSGNNFSIFTTWEKLHGYETLQSSQYDVTSTNSTGTYYFTSEQVETGEIQTTYDGSVYANGTQIPTFTPITETVLTPVIPSEIKSEFQVEYRYMLETGEVESFTRITNNDVNLENHYFQFINKFDGVNYQQFNLGDDIEFTDDTFIGTYYATAENVPQKYISIAEQGYPLYYSLEKGIEWWTGAGATIYMDGEEKKLNVQVDFGKDREPLALNTMQELDPTLTLSTSAQKKIQTDGSSGDTNDCSVSGSPYPAWVSSDPQNMYMSHEGNGNGVCSLPVYQFDISSLPTGAVVSDVDVEYDLSTGGTITGIDGFDWINSDQQVDYGSGSTLMDHYNELRGNTQYVQVGKTAGTDLTADLGSQADTDVGNAISNGWFAIGARMQPFDNLPSDSPALTTANVELILTYDIPKVLNAPTNLSATGTSTSQIDLSWTAPSPSGTGEYPAVSGYRIQSSDFAFANSSLPTGRSADADVYGAIDGGVDMDTANLYLSMNTTQYTGAYPNSIGSHTATLSGASSNSATAINGKTSLDFDGSNDYISLGTALNNSDGNGDIVSDTGAWTWAGWVYVDSTSDSHNHIVFSKIYNDYESGKEHSMFLRQATSNWLLMSTEGGSVNNAVAHTGWTHLAVTVSGIGGTQTWSIYEDGGTPATFSASNHYWDNEPILLGGQDTGNDDTPDTRWMDGQMQDFAFWNRALSQAEIQSLVNSYDYSSSTGSGNTGKVATTIPSGLIAYYPLDSTTVINSLYSADDENNILDESYRGNHATLYDGTTKDPANSSITNARGLTATDWDFEGNQSGSHTHSIDSGVKLVSSGNTGNGAGVAVHDLGEALGDTWTVRYEFTMVGSYTNGGNGYISVGLSDDDSYTSGQHTLSQGGDAVVWVWHLGNSNDRNQYMKIFNDGSSANSDTQSSRSWADDTTYYMELKNDGTQLLHQRYSDSTYSTVAETGNLSDDKGGDYTTGLRYVIFGGTDTGANQGGYTAKITNLDVYPNGVLNPLSLSLDSSLNMEGTNSAVLDGSNNYMTISGTNTIIPTSSAFMMGANIKPDKIVSATTSNAFTSDTGITTSDSTNLLRDTSNNHLDVNYHEGTDDSIALDLGSGAVSDTAWVLRFKQTVNTYGSSDNYSQYGVGLTSADHSSSSITSNQDSVLFVNTIGSSLDRYRIYLNDNTKVSGGTGQVGTFTTTSGTGDKWIELSRDGSTFTSKIYSDSSYETLTESESVTLSGTISGLRYFKASVYDESSTGNTLTISIDDLLFYNGISNLNDQTIFSYQASNGSVEWNIEGANMVFRNGETGNAPVITAPHGMSAGTKYNVAVSRDGSNNFELWVNGDRIGSATTNSTALLTGASRTNSVVYSTDFSNAVSDGFGETGDQVSVQSNTIQHAFKVFSNSHHAGTYPLSAMGLTNGLQPEDEWTLTFKVELTNQDRNNSGGSTGSASIGAFSITDESDHTVNASTDGNHDYIQFDYYNIGTSYSYEVPTVSYSFHDNRCSIECDGIQPSGNSYTDTDQRIGSGGNDGLGTEYVKITKTGGATDFALDFKMDNNSDFSSPEDERSLSNSDLTSSARWEDGLDSALTHLHWTTRYNANPASALAHLQFDDVAITMSETYADSHYIGVAPPSPARSDAKANYFDGKIDEFYVMTGQSDDTISDISSRSENVFTDRTYKTTGGSATATTYSHTSISGGGGTYVAYKVSPWNSVGLGAYDLVLGQTANTPSAPQNLSIASTSPTVLTLDWDAPASQGASSISAYKVYRGTSSGFTLDSNSLVTTITDTSVTEYANSGLTADTRYYFSVLATNAQGDGTQADADAYTLLNAPTSLTATGVSTSQINLAWTAPSGANNLDGYKIEYNDGSWQNLVADTGGTGTTHSHTGLSTGNSFTYRVSGLNGSLAGLSSATAQGSTYAVPSAITDLSGTGLTGSSLRISWTAPSSTPALTGYMIEISEDNFSTSTTLESNTGNTDTSYDATGLSENVDYYFRVKAINSLGTASTSNIPIVQTGASQSGGGGGGSGSPSFIPQFDELISLSVFGNAHKLTLGESIQDTLRLEWNSAEDLQVNEVIVGDNPFRFAVQKPPFIVLGDADGLSNAEISYTIQVPNNYCTMDITVQCVEPDFYEIPINVKVLSEGRTITKNVVITVDLSSGFDPALFVILLVAGIASFGIYRISKGSSGKKKNGSVRKTVNSKPKGRKNGSVKKALAL